MKKLIILTLCTALYHSPLQADVTTLSPKIRQVLQEEMQQIDAGLKQIFQAYYSGDDKKIIDIAKKVEQSFILKKKLTSEQKHELHEKLPKAFIERDQLFHYYAGMLAHVAEKDKQELVGFYISKLADACADCHRQYATHRFPLFENKKVKHEHHH